VQYLQASQQQVIVGLLQSRRGGSICINVYAPSWYNDNYARPMRMFIGNAIASVVVGVVWFNSMSHANGTP
jgi:hypothetical protein